MIPFTHSIGPDTRISFPTKPSEAVRALLKGAGFRWSPSVGCWRCRGCQGAADFLAALDRKLNPDRPDGACWRCRSPQGFLRPHGAATPVYCDACHSASQANRAGEPAPNIDRFDLDFEDRCRDTCGLCPIRPQRTAGSRDPVGRLLGSRRAGRFQEDQT